MTYEQWAMLYYEGYEGLWESSSDAKDAWDYQQLKIDNLNQQITELKKRISDLTRKVEG